MTGGGFTGPALAAGSVLGVRAFGVDVLGRLRGVAYGDVFRPGLNVARCNAPPQGRWVPGPAGDMTLEREPGHRAGTAECWCGYWAHYDGSHSYHAPTRAAAVIEGHGLVTLGTSGFRAEKARLVALVPPAHLPIAARVADVYGSAGVPIYRTLADALTEHPVTHPRRDPLPHPDTHPDFWALDEQPRTDPSFHVQAAINMAASLRWFSPGGVVRSSREYGIDRRPKPQGMRPPRPGRGDTTKTYPTSGDVIRKGKRR